MSPKQLTEWFERHPLAGFEPASPDDSPRVRAARLLGITAPAIFQWEVEGAIPGVRQYQIELATRGGLKADVPADRTLRPPEPAPEGAQ